MEILGNMQLLSSCSHVLMSYAYQNGYCECRESQRYHYGRCAMLKLVFVAPNFRLRLVQKNGKKEQKMKSRVSQKTLFYFSVFTSWTQFRGSIRIEKIVWERCARQNFFLTCHQLLGAQFWKFHRTYSHHRTMTHLSAVSKSAEIFRWP